MKNHRVKQHKVARNQVGDISRGVEKHFLPWVFGVGVIILILIAGQIICVARRGGVFLSVKYYSARAGYYILKRAETGIGAVYKVIRVAVGDTAQHYFGRHGYALRIIYVKIFVHLHTPLEKLRKCKTN